MFITFEGGEGSGKSTQSLFLYEYLLNKGIKAIRTREPGGSPGAEEIRQLLVNGPADRWSSKAEALLMFASRADHVENLIAPKLEGGEWVICDRFADSSIAYQGYGRGLPRNFLETLYAFTVGPYSPDLTFILDIDPEIGLSRAHGRMAQNNKDAMPLEGRFESFDLSFHQKVRQGFLEIAHNNPSRCHLISASLPLLTIQEQIINIIEGHLKKRGL
jgi:dTMP kinase